MRMTSRYFSRLSRLRPSTGFAGPEAEDARSFKVMESSQPRAETAPNGPQLTEVSGRLSGLIRTSIQAGAYCRLEPNPTLWLP